MVNMFFTLATTELAIVDLLLVITKGEHLRLDRKSLHTAIDAWQAHVSDLV